MWAGSGISCDTHVSLVLCFRLSLWLSMQFLCPKFYPLYFSRNASFHRTHSLFLFLFFLVHIFFSHFNWGKKNEKKKVFYLVFFLLLLLLLLLILNEGKKILNSCKRETNVLHHYPLLFFFSPPPSYTACVTDEKENGDDD